MNVFSEKFNKKLKEMIGGLENIYSHSNKDEFVFIDRTVEISSVHINKLNEVQIIGLLKSIALPQRDIKIKSIHEHNVSINIARFDVDEYYSPTDIKELGDNNPIAQKIKASEYLKKVVTIANKLNRKEESNTFTSSKWRNVHLKESIDILRVELVEENNDATYVNKQHETVYQREIFVEGKAIGAIEYLEDGNSVTILRSDVEEEHQGKGIGYNAYVKLIEDKIALGKTVGSDSILSAQAQSIYKRLGEAGYRMESQYTRLMTRGKITSLSTEDTSSQRRDFPTVNIDGVGVSATGYRFKGESVFKISPSTSINPSPVINITEGSISTSIYPSFVKRDVVEHPANILSEDDYSKIEFHLMEARNILSHPENKEIRDTFTMDNVSIHNVQIVPYEELTKSVEMALKNNLESCHYS